MKWIKFFIRPPKITWEQAMEKIFNDKNKNIILLDLRQPFEIKEKKIENSISIPLSKINQEYFKLEKNKTIFLFCRSGKRSSIAARILKTKGYENLFNIKGGIKAYKKNRP